MPYRHHRLELIAVHTGNDEQMRAIATMNCSRVELHH
jgi:hypothetical protein